LAGLLLGFAASVAVVQLLDIKAYAAILWLPILVACIWFVTPMAARLAASVASPLRVINPSAKGSAGYKYTLSLFVCSWITLVLLAVTYGSFTGWLAFLLGHSSEEAAASTGLWSIPLGLVNREFFITPNKGLGEVLGIIIANSYFNALALTIVFKVVHGFIRRSRITQLGISGTTIDDDDGL
jgi:hypothetical protein